MEFDTSDKPFPYMMARNFYDETELKLIWDEINYWSSGDKMLEPKETGQKMDGKKQNKGIFLDEAYTERKYSNILTVNRKLFRPDIMDMYMKLHFTYEVFSMCNKDTTLLSYYENDGFYKAHKDSCVITALTWIFKEPKAFTGGDFVMPQYNHTIKIENNMTLWFPSCVEHEVPAIKLNDGVPEGKGFGRYCISSFVTFRG